MRVAVAVDSDAHFLVQSHHIVPDFCIVPGPPDQEPSLLVLGNQIEPDDRPTLPVLPRPRTHPILLVTD